MKRRNFTQLFFVVIMYLLGTQTLLATVSNPPETLPVAPTHNATDVLSIYSGAYTNATTIGSLSGVGTIKEERTVLGDNMLYFENGLNSWSYINFGSPVNISDYNVIFMDIYVVSGLNTDIKISFGDGTSTFNIRVTEGWNKVEIDMNDYRILPIPPNFTQIRKIGIINNSGSARTIYVDNIYACKAVPTELLTAPTQPAATPTQSISDVLPVFSDAYSNGIGFSVLALTPGSPKKYKGINFPPSTTIDKMFWIKGGMTNGDGGLLFTTPQNVSSYDYLHLDLYLDGISFPMRFRFGTGTGSIAPNPSIPVFTAQPGWNSINIKLSDFVALSTGFDLSTMNGFGFWHKTGGTRTVFIDNVYFYKVPPPCNSPNLYTVSGSAAICQGSTTEISFSGSQSDATYQLYKNGTAFGTTTQGTGSALIWIVSEAGTYIVKTTTANNYCETAMDGSAIVTTALQTNITSQNTSAATYNLNGTAMVMSVTATGSNLNYQWYSNSSAINKGGMLIDGAITSEYTPSTTTLGTQFYYCVVQGDCGIITSAVSGAITVAQSGDFKSKSDGNWENNNSWKKWSGSAWVDAVSGETPGAGSNVYIDASEITINTPAIVNNISINSDGKLTLDENQTLRVSGNFNIFSDIENNTGTFVDKNSDGGVTINGQVNVQQYLTGGRNWYISSPVENASTGIIIDKSGNSLYEYNENNNSWPEATSFENTKGYVASIGVNNTSIYTFSSENLNQGNQTVNLLRSETAPKKGFNLIGNPFPSFINIRTIINTTPEIEKSVWYRVKNRTNSTYYFDTYNTSSGLGTNNNEFGNVTGIIPPMQAVWLRVAPTFSTANLLLAGNLRCHKNETANPLRSPQSDNQKIIRLEVSNDTFGDEAIIYFNNLANDNYDVFDSPKMSNNNVLIPEIYTKAGDDFLTINGLNDFDINKEIPIYFKTGAAGSFTLVVKELAHFSDTKIILKDNITKDEILLNEESKYKFNSEVSNNAFRFVIQFKTPVRNTFIKNVQGCNFKIEDNLNGAISIYCDEIKSDEGIISIFNNIGQFISRNKTTGSRTVINNLNTGIYFVSVKINGIGHTEKFIVK